LARTTLLAKKTPEKFDQPLNIARRRRVLQQPIPNNPRTAQLASGEADERESRTDISQVELQLHGLRVAPRRGLHQLRREDRGADP
jgi:hypothetical protein